MNVYDASAIVEFLLGSPRGVRVADQLGNDRGGHVPETFAAEVLSALRGAERGGQVDPGELDEVVDDLRWLPLRYHVTDPLLDGVWSLRHNLTTYDALYVSLARRLGTGLVTCDARMAAAPDLGIPVTVVT